MRDEIKAERQEAIASAALALLQERGYAGMSMLAVAKRAQASNETLYRWFGDKTGLCLALIARDLAFMRLQMEPDLAGNRPPLEILRGFGPKLLGLLLSERTVALSRAAAADPSGTLGAAIAEGGRNVIRPIIGQVMRRARSAGVLQFDDPGAAVSVYLGLLLGDLQIRRVVGREAEPETVSLSRRAKIAHAQFLRLMGPQVV